MITGDLRRVKASQLICKPFYKALRIFVRFVENYQIRQRVIYSNLVAAEVWDRLRPKLVVGFKRIIVVVQNFAIKLEIYLRHRIISLKLGKHIVTNVFLNLSLRIIVLFALDEREILPGLIFLTIGFESFQALFPFSCERLLDTIEILALHNRGIVLAETAVVTINCLTLVEHGEEMDRYYLPSEVISIIIMFDYLLRLHLDGVQLKNGLVEDLRQKEKSDARHDDVFEIQTQKRLHIHGLTISWFVENQFTIVVREQIHPSFHGLKLLHFVHYRLN